MNFKEHNDIHRWLISEKSRLIKFCENNRSIYVYGAGNFGSSINRYLQMQNIDVDGFVVSKKENACFEEKNIYNINELKCTSNDYGIVVALSSQFHEDVCKLLKKNEVSNDRIFILTDRFMQVCTRLARIEPCHLASLKVSSPPLSYNGSKDWESICVICVDGIGDLVMTTPFLRELRRIYRHSNITLIISSTAKSLFADCPYIDKLLAYNPNNLTNAESGINRKTKLFIQEYLPNVSFDVVFLPGSSSWVLVNFFLAVHLGSSVRIAHGSYGMLLGDGLYQKEYESMYSIVAEDKKIQHEVERRLDLIRVLGNKTENTRLELWLSEKDKIWLHEKMGNMKNDLYVALVPVASGASRCWDIRKMANVLRLLVQKYPSIKFVLLGANNTAEAARLFVSNVPQKNLINMVNQTTLKEAAAIVSECKMYLGMNTGLMSVAAAFGVPVVEICVHPKTCSDAHDNSPCRYRAWGVPDIVVRPEKPLEGCREGCTRSIAHCINQITESEVYEATVKMIEEQGFI